LKPLGRKSALIVIDMQCGFDDLAWGSRNNPGLEGCVALLLRACRDAGVPIIHAHHHSTHPLGLFQPGTRGCEPKPQAAPRNGEAVYYKRVNSAFIGTTLERDLRDQGIENLVIVGLTTNHCISTTVRMAGNLGFDTYVVADATAAFERCGADGRLRAADEVHNAALGDLHGEFAEVVDARTIISALTREDRGSTSLPAASTENHMQEPF
jgi:nicotinamidase-related amidase